MCKSEAAGVQHQKIRNEQKMKLVATAQQGEISTNVHQKKKILHNVSTFFKDHVDGRHLDPDKSQGSRETLKTIFFGNCGL